jgi:endonuclease YncB( thermonuclease family)
LVSDGDTIVVLRGVDTPEKTQAFSTRSWQFASELVFGQVIDVRMHGVDRYGRLVGVVWLPNGRSLNRELVRAGISS